MKQKITFLLVAVMCFTTLISAQTMVNDFEAEMPTGFEAKFGATAAVVSNPNMSGLNTTNNVLRIGRTGDTDWWQLVLIDVDPDLAVSTTDDKYLTFMAYGVTGTDIRARFNATSDTNNGTNPGIIPSENKYTTEGEWQQVVIQIRADANGFNFDGGTVFNIIFHPDLNNTVNESFVMNDTDKVLYIDELQIVDGNPLSVGNFELDKNVSLYPNPAQTSFKLNVKNNTTVSKVSLYNVLGKEVMQNIVNTDNVYDISNLASGLYLVKIIDNNGSISTKKLLKE